MPNVFEILAEPKRQAILRLVWTGEKSAGEIAAKFEVTFGAVSQHLAVLRSAGFVDLRKQGRQRLYRANRRKLGPLAAYLESMWTNKLDKLKLAAEQEENLAWKQTPSKYRSK